MQPFIISFFLLLPESWSNSVHHHLFSKLISWSESSVFHFPHISLLAALTPFLPGVKLLVRKIFFVLLVLLVASSLRPSGVCLEKPLINNFSVHFLKVSNFSFYKTSLQVFMIPSSLLVFLVTATTAWLTDRRKMEWLTGWKVFFWRDHFTVTRHAHTKSEKNARAIRKWREEKNDARVSCQLLISPTSLDTAATEYTPWTFFRWF